MTPVRAKHRLDIAGVKAALNVIEFYRHELGDEFRPRKSFGWADAGRCVFHDDRHAGSFRVHCESGRFKCFACDASGDPIEFVIRHHGLAFDRAVEYLKEFI